MPGLVGIAHDFGECPSGASVENTVWNLQFEQMEKESSSPDFDEMMASPVFSFFEQQQRQAAAQAGIATQAQQSQNISANAPQLSISSTTTSSLSAPTPLVPPISTAAAEASPSSIIHDAMEEFPMMDDIDPGVALEPASFDYDEKSAKRIPRSKTESKGDRKQRNVKNLKRERTDLASTSSSPKKKLKRDPSESGLSVNDGAELESSCEAIWGRLDLDERTRDVITNTLSPNVLSEILTQGDVAIKRHMNKFKNLSPEQKEAFDQFRKKSRAERKSRKEKMRRNQVNRLFDELSSVLNLTQGTKDMASILSAAISFISKVKNTSSSENANEITHHEQQ